MANIAINNLQQITNGYANDYLLIIHNANTIPTTNIITVNNFSNTISSFIVTKGPFANDLVAQTNGVVVKGLYYDATGTVKIRLV